MFKFCPYCGSQVKEQSKSGFQCPICKKWTYYVSSPTTSVVVKVGNEVLLAVRAIDPAKGSLDIVGGFLKYGEDPIDGVVREFKEEVGLKIDPTRLKYLGIWVDTYNYQGEDMFCFNVVYWCEFDKKFVGKPMDDVAVLIWVPLSKTPNFAFPYLYKVWEKIRLL